VKVGDVDIRWAPKLRPEKLYRLYQTDARGILDEELIDEVAYALYSRCESILTITDAFAGRLKCPRCGFIIQRQTSGGCDEAIHCPACAWQTTWKEYHQTWQNRQLWGGNAVEAFREYVRCLPSANSPREKMILIDQLIHAHHCDLRRQTYNRPAAANLIEGGMKKVIEFLDSLSYGENSSPGLQETHAAWQERVEISRGRRPSPAGKPEPAQAGFAPSLP
jgi:predicted RNA-binding Zn-ribbon protein involved in translation (DUF1610 family)